MSFKYFILILLFSLSASRSAIAQENDNANHIFGKVIDSKTGQPTEFASASLFSIPKDSLVTGVLISDKGEFSFANVPFGVYKLRIRFIGYNDYEQKIFVNAKNMNQDLGIIKIDQSAAQLNEVEIVAEKPVMQLSIDKKIFNVEKDLSVKGGTGMDALKNIPEVSIDPDGTITLRNNSNVIIYIDGRVTNLTLDQIPADQIESIEIITNPSAKYDANTSGGIINVLLKQNTKPYFNGSLIGGIGTNNKYNGTASLNGKTRLFNITSIFSYNTATNYIKQYSLRNNITNPDPIKYYDEFDTDGLIRTTAMAKIVVDYAVNKRNTITIGGTYNQGEYIANDNQNYTTRDSSNAEYSYGDRYNNNTNTFRNFVSLLSHKKTFLKKGKEWTSTVQYTSGAGGGGYLYTTDNVNIGQAPIPGPTLQNNVIDGQNHIFLFQSDFTNPINDSTKIEYGVKSTYKRTQSDNTTNDYSYVTNEYVYDSVFSNDYLINDLVNAAYINYSTRIKKISIQAGLRFEDSYYQGIILNKPNENFGYSYPSSASTISKSLFPALYISKKVNKKSEFQFNISRKINRPNFFQMLPVVTAADNFDYTKGNPSLQPEFANKAEINYNYTTEKINYLTSIYGQYTQNSIVNYLYPSSTNPDILINSYKNSAGTFTYGWENIAKATLWKKLTVTGTITPYYTLIEYTSAYDGTQGTSQGWSQNSKLVISYKLPKDFTFQTNGTYESPKPLAQGETSNMRYFDLALSKTIKKRFFLNLILSDVLNTKQKGKDYYTPEYTQISMSRREARYLKLNFTWTFGKMDSAKKKNNKPANDNNNDYDQL